MLSTLRLPLAALLALGASFAASPPRPAAAQDLLTERERADCHYYGGEWGRYGCVYPDGGSTRPSTPAEKALEGLFMGLLGQAMEEAYGWRLPGPPVTPPVGATSGGEAPDRYSRAANPHLLSFSLSPAERWMAVAATRDQAEARRLGEEYGARFVMTQVFARTEGDYLVVVGLEEADKAQELVDTMIREKRIPAGSFVTRGETIQDRIWATERVLAASARR